MTMCITGFYRSRSLPKIGHDRSRGERQGRSRAITSSVAGAIVGVAAKARTAMLNVLEQIGGA